MQGKTRLANLESHGVDKSQMYPGLEARGCAGMRAGDSAGEMYWTTPSQNRGLTFGGRLPENAGGPPRSFRGDRAASESSVPAFAKRQWRRRPSVDFKRCRSNCRPYAFSPAVGGGLSGATLSAQGGAGLLAHGRGVHRARSGTAQQARFALGAPLKVLIDHDLGPPLKSVAVLSLLSESMTLAESGRC